MGLELIPVLASKDSHLGFSFWRRSPWQSSSPLPICWGPWPAATASSTCLPAPSSPVPTAILLHLYAIVRAVAQGVSTKQFAREPGCSYPALLALRYKLQDWTIEGIAPPPLALAAQGRHLLNEIIQGGKCQ
jgi:hypothetical protein